jgi:hypothetical protein
MARRKCVNGVMVDFTPEEEAARDAEEAAYAAAPVITREELAIESKTLKALALVMRAYCNALQAGTFTQKTVADVKADFLTAYRSLP